MMFPIDLEQPRRMKLWIKISKLLCVFFLIGSGTLAHAGMYATPNPNFGTYTVSWDSVGGVDGYRLQESIDGGSTYPNTGFVDRTTSELSFAYSGKAPDVYTYRVKECHLVGPGNEQELQCIVNSGNGTINVTVNITVPDTPTGLTGPGTDYNGNYSLSWGSVVGATYYELEQSVGNANNFVLIESPSNASQSLSGRAPNTYYYRVSACNADAVCSSPSSSTSVTVANPPATPIAPSVPETSTTGTVVVTWSTSTGSTTYKLQERKDGGSWGAAFAAVSPKTLSNRGSGVYDYRVQGCNQESVCGSFSAASNTINVIDTGGTGTITASPLTNTGTYTVSWTPVPDSDGYKLDENDGSGWQTGVNTNVTQPSMSFADVDPGSYEYRVRICNEVGGGPDPGTFCADSGYGTVTVQVNEPIPGTPTGLTGPGTDYNGNFALNWNDVSGASSYRLEESVGNANSFSLIASPPTNSQPVNGRAPNTYYYRVSACNADAGCSSPSSSTSVTVANPPATPTAPSVPETSNNGIVVVTWSASTGSATYKLQERKDGGNWGAAFAAASPKTLNNRGSGVYDYRVQGCNQESVCGSFSAASNTINVIDTGGTGTITASPLTNTGTYTVSWTPVPDSDGYKLDENDGSGWQIGVNTNVTQPSMSFADVDPGAYEYRVRICNEVGGGPDPGTFCADSGYGTVTVQVNQAIPNTPTGLAGPATDNDGSFELNWNVVNGAATYDLEQSVGNTNNFVSISTPEGNSQTLSGLEPNNYYYRVSACNSLGQCSNASAVIQVDVISLPETPANLTGPDVDFDGDGSFTLMWDASANAQYYLLEENDGTNGWNSAYEGTATSADINGRDAGEYSYRVSGCIYSPDLCSDSSAIHTVEVTTGAVQPPASEIPDPSGPAPVFTLPDSADFPDAAIINPVVPAGDVGLNSVGALDGSGGVSGGQASYSIPIVIPPGRNSMQPQVGLGYSSSGSNGIAGVGWGVSGAESISRCAATIATDGYIADVQYDVNRDRLCLNGQRLIATSGLYGHSGTAYRTELDSFARVTQSGGMNDVNANFTVEAKSGTVSTFGTVTNARLKAGGRVETLSWLLYEQRDRSGNTIRYTYTDFGDGEQLLSTIHYTGKDGSLGNRRVTFVYEDRPDQFTAYKAGGKSRSSKRLANVRTYYNNLIIREYTLAYALSASTARSLLRTVEECAFENGVTRHCLPATSFSWQESAPQYVTEPLQFSNNGTVGAVLGDKRWLHDVMPHGDDNGDGVLDWPDFYTNAEGEITGSRISALANCFKESNSFSLTCIQVDFDLDGRTDNFRKNSGQLQVKSARSGNWVNTGISWTDSSLASGDDSPIAFADLNGDGWPDLLYKQGNKLYFHAHTESPTNPYTDANKDLVYIFPAGAARGSLLASASVPGDMDGNGTVDIVISSGGGAGAPGLPRPSQLLLTQSTADPSDDNSLNVVTRSFTGLGLPIHVNAVFFHDLNGDGLPDLLRVNPNDEGAEGDLQYRLNMGTDFESTWADLGMTIPMRGPENYAIPDGSETYFQPIMSKVLIMDYDGDGIDEILTPESVLASSCAEVEPEGYFCDDDLYGTFEPKMYMNFGQPIHSDILDDSVRRYRAYSFSEDTNGNITTSSFTSDIAASASQTAVIDATGDGLPDVVTVFGCRFDSCGFNQDSTVHGGTVTDPAYAQEGAWINRNLGAAINGERYAGRDLMSAVENGYGVRDEWIYRPLSSDEYDLAHTDFYQTDHEYLDGSFDYFHFTSSMYVVADHRMSNGVGGLNSAKYRYRGAVYHNKGRGFQGFKTIISEVDVFDAGDALANTDLVTRTDFHQMWPLTSMIEQSCTWAASANAINDNPDCAGVIAYSSTDDIHNIETKPGVRFVAIKAESASNYDLVSFGEIDTTLVTRSFDLAGNVTHESTQYSDEYQTNLSETDRDFSIDFNAWWLNRITSSSITTHPVQNRYAGHVPIDPQTDNVKIITSSYSSYDEAQRLPTIVVTSANDTSLTRTKSLVHNDYGLVTDETLTGTGVTVPRQSFTNYSDNGFMNSGNGYFPFKLTNAAGHESTLHTDPAHGIAVGSQDANGLITQVGLDPFGRTIDVTAPGQPTSYVRYFWCSGMNCADNAVFKKTSYSAGSPVSTAYIDQMGRTVKTDSENFEDGSTIHTRVEFDERGNVIFESVPYDLALNNPDDHGTRFFGFDALGRYASKKIDQASNGSLDTTYQYDGQKTTIVTNGLSMYRIYSGKRLIEMQDAMGGYTRYAYDGANSPIALQDANGTPIVASFNALGLKDWVLDPNMGVKDFAYNGLGEVLSETDANGDLIAMKYDVLGRTTDRLVNGDLVGKWYFDNPAPNKGLGLLDYEDSQFNSDTSRLQKYYFYSNSNTGRKDLVQVTHRFYQNSDPDDYIDYDTQYFHDTYYARSKGIRYPGGLSVGHEYNERGFLKRETDAISGDIYREITNLDARGQIRNANLANHDGGFVYATSATYFHETGQARRLTATGLGNTFKHLTYTYDGFGNLKNQINTWGDNYSRESFTYDNLHRVKQSRRTYGTSITQPLDPDYGQPYGGRSTPSGGKGGNQIDIVNYGYDAVGNLTYKSDYATAYNYNPARPNSVSSVELIDGGTASFTYDDNGNILTGAGKTTAYNAFNKPTSISFGSSSTYFQYGANTARYRQDQTNGKQTLYIDKLMEIVTQGANTDYRHYVSNVAIVTKKNSLSDNSPTINYLHVDRLGSLTTITNASGDVTARRSFDAFGKPRGWRWTDLNNPVLAYTATERGFTSHEHLDDYQMIHMNGRVYDYNLGRFYSVDPYIVDPTDGQSINPYAYVMNNPLSRTDPSGYQAEKPEKIKRDTSVTGSRLKFEKGKVPSILSGRVKGFSDNGSSKGKPSTEDGQKPNEIEERQSSQQERERPAANSFTDKANRPSTDGGTGSDATASGNSSAARQSLEEESIWTAVKGFGESVAESVAFGVNAVADGIAEDYREGGKLGVIIGATGGRSDGGFIEDTNSNYLRTSIVVGPLKNVDKMIVSVALGGAITKSYGGYSFGDLILKGPARHLGTYRASAVLAAQSTVINAVVITATYEASNYAGSLLRTTVNRTARFFE